MKKIILILLTLATVLSSFIACTTDTPDDSTEATSQSDLTTEPSDSTPETEDTEPENKNLLEYNGEYILTGDVTITKANAATNATYQALLDVFEGTAYDSELKTLNGQGYTITTEVGLFDVIGNCTVKNLKVDGNVTLSNSDFVDSNKEGTNKAFGVIAAVAYNPVTFEDVTMDVDITYTGNIGTIGVSIGSLVGYGGVYRLTNCKNNGNITATPASCGMLSVGGMIGYKDNACSVLMENCINNGNLVAKKAGKVTADLYAGGIAGCSYEIWDVLNNSMNTGSITAEQDTPKHTRIGGLVGHYHAIAPTDCINLGDISVHYSSTSPFTSYKEFLIGGILGSGFYNMTVTRCFNAGDIKCTTAGASIRPSIGGIVSWQLKGTGTFIDCVNIGSIDASCTDVKSGITPFNNMNNAIFNNCYSVAITSDFNKFYNQDSSKYPAANSDAYFITVGADVETYLSKIKTEQMSDGMTAIIEILSKAKYDTSFAHNNDDGMTLKSTIIG